MKPRLTGKMMLTLTLFCVLITVIDLSFGRQWTSPRDMKTVFSWIILLIGWAVYFLDRFKKR